MIDIENELYTKVATALRASFPGVFVTGEYVKAPPSFPCVMFQEMDNTAYQRTQTQDDMENHARVMYELDVFSALETGRKSECKAIVKVVDGIMQGCGFTRIFLNPIPNAFEGSIYRVKGRYVAVVSKDRVVFRR